MAPFISGAIDKGELSKHDDIMQEKEHTLKTEYKTNLNRLNLT